MIGIVGGIGPFAGVNLLQKVFENTIASTDQQHLDVVLLNKSSKIKDRTEYILGDVEENPAYALVDIIYELYKAGATITAIPCNTAHCEEIFNVIQLELKKNNIGIRILHMIEECIAFISTNHPDLKKIGILCTTGAYKTELYTTALQDGKLEPINVPLEIQETLIHPAIYDKSFGIKANPNPVHFRAKENLYRGISILKKKGAEAIILGCSEIPIAIPETKLDNIILFDPATILARALIREYHPEKLKSI